MCFAWIWEQPANISLHSINYLVLITEVLLATDWVFTQDRYSFVLLKGELCGLCPPLLLSGKVARRNFRSARWIDVCRLRCKVQFEGERQNERENDTARFPRDIFSSPTRGAVPRSTVRLEPSAHIVLISVRVVAGIRVECNNGLLLNVQRQGPTGWKDGYRHRFQYRHR